MYEVTHRTCENFDKAGRILISNIRAMNNNINMFDRYLRGEMTIVEQDNFKRLLAENAETANDFKIYLALVDGICKEEQQDNIEFAVAMKGLSKEQLKQVIGKRKKPGLRILHSRQMGLWAVSMAAMLILCLSITHQINQEAEYSVDNLVAEYNAIPTSNRSGGSKIDIASLDKESVRNVIPQLLSDYQKTSIDDIQIKQISGINLAMAYLKINDREKAIKVLQELKSFFPDDPEIISQCNKILKQIR